MASASGPALTTRGAVYLLFFLSGAAGLLFQVVWFYQTGLALGSSAWAVTAVLSAFMGGLALGNRISMRWSLSPARSLRVYALLELAILATGLGLVYLLPLLGRVLAPVLGPLVDAPAMLHPLRFVVAFLLLLVPSTAMGLTLPVMSQALEKDGQGFREVLGSLYGLNTLGAVLGTLAAEFLLLPRIGVDGTAMVAAGCDAVAAAGAWLLASRFPGQAAATQGIPHAIPWRIAPGLAAVALAGMLMLALEVVWLRFLVLFVSSTSAALSVMLATVLAGIALGGLAAARLPARIPVLAASGAPVLMLAGAFCALSYALFPLYHRPPDGGIIRTFLPTLRVSLLLEFPTAFLSGWFFTVAGSRLRDRMGSHQAAAGALTFCNTLGAALGAGLAGILLIPKLGVEGSIVLAAGLYVGAGLLWWRVDPGPRPQLLASAAVAAAVLAFFPFGSMLKRHLPWLAGVWTRGMPARVAAVREGTGETLVYLEARSLDRTLNHRMLTNSFSMTANTVLSDRYMKQFVYLPLALHPGPRSALLVCFGVGSTAGALTASADFGRIDVVDISRDVLELSRVVFPDPPRNPLSDPRVRVHIEDGRFFLQSSRDRWDLITGEPPPPTIHGVASLFSAEHFRLIHDHLNEGGIATYWLPAHSLHGRAALSIARAWAETFPTCFLWRSSLDDFILVGFRGAPANVDGARLDALWRSPLRKGLEELGFESPAQMASGFVGDGAYLRRISASEPPATDAFPKRVLAGDAASNAVYQDWLDIGASKARFRTSAPLVGIWPQHWIDRTVQEFDLDGILFTLGTAAQVDRFPSFPALHQLLTATPWRTPAMWVLGSDRDHQRVVDETSADHRARPLARFHLGVRALAERDYAAAAEHLRVSAEAAPARRTEVAAFLFAACMAGQRERAEAFLASPRRPPAVDRIPDGYWKWMQDSFGLQAPRRP